MIASQPQMQAGVTAINDQGLPRASNDRVRGKSRQLPIDPLPHPKGQGVAVGQAGKRTPLSLNPGRISACGMASIAAPQTFEFE